MSLIFTSNTGKARFGNISTSSVETPAVARNAFQRVYDMILTYGSEQYTQFKQDAMRYHFFADPIDGGADAIYGLERPADDASRLFPICGSGIRH